MNFGSKLYNLKKRHLTRLYLHENKLIKKIKKNIWSIFMESACTYDYNRFYVDD